VVGAGWTNKLNRRMIRGVPMRYSRQGVLSPTLNPHAIVAGYNSLTK